VDWGVVPERKPAMGPSWTFGLENQLRLSQTLLDVDCIDDFAAGLS
jgi:hypothetical protein